MGNIVDLEDFEEDFKQGQSTAIRCMTMLFAQIADNPEVVRNSARLAKIIFDEHVAVGFSETQALELTKIAMTNNFVRVQA